MALIAAVIVLCLHEYGLILLAGKKPVNRIALMVFGVIMMLGALAARVPAMADSANNIAPFFVGLSVMGIFLVEVLSSRRSMESAANTLLGVMLIPWALMYLINLRLLDPYGEYFTYMLFISVWAGDCMAYFIGTKFGKHRLNKEVSPKKSWEGFFAGVLGAVIAAVVCWEIFFPWYITWWAAALLGLAISLSGQLADLAESLIKRSNGVKDSSAILPGHGGFLDRFDSYLFAAPVLYYIILAFI